MLFETTKSPEILTRKMLYENAKVDGTLRGFTMRDEDPSARAFSTGSKENASLAPIDMVQWRITAPPVPCCAPTANFWSPTHHRHEGVQSLAVVVRRNFSVADGHKRSDRPVQACQVLHSAHRLVWTSWGAGWGGRGGCGSGVRVVRAVARER